MGFNNAQILLQNLIFDFSAEINFFHGFAGTGFLERISLAIPAEKTKKLITKNFRDSVY